MQNRDCHTSAWTGQLMKNAISSRFLMSLLLMPNIVASYASGIAEGKHITEIENEENHIGEKIRVKECNSKINFLRAVF